MSIYINHKGPIHIQTEYCDGDDCQSLESNIHFTDPSGNEYEVVLPCNEDSVHLPLGECDECSAFEKQVEHLQEEIGDLDELQTEDKDNLVDAINEILQTGAPKGIWYGTCTQEPGSIARNVTTITGDFVLETGNVVFVKMYSSSTNGSYTLNVDGTGAKDLYVQYSPAGIQVDSYGMMWSPGEVVCCVYDGTRYIAIAKPKATTTYYGITKLDDTLSVAGLSADAKAVGDAITTAISTALGSVPIAKSTVYGLVKVARTINSNGGGYITFTYHTPQDTEESYTVPYLASLGPSLPDPVVGRDYLPYATTSAKGAVILDRNLNTQDRAADAKAVGDAMPTSASINNSGLITFKNAANTSVFTLQLPIYNGGVNP